MSSFTALPPISVASVKAATWQELWFGEIIDQWVIAADVRSPKIVTAFSFFSQVLAGKSQVIMLIVDLQQDKIKKPGDPGDRDLPEDGAFRLGWCHGQDYLFTAVAALPAFPR